MTMGKSLGMALESRGDLHLEGEIGHLAELAARLGRELGVHDHEVHVPGVLLLQDLIVTFLEDTHHVDDLEVAVIDTDESGQGIERAHGDESGLDLP